MHDLKVTNDPKRIGFYSGLVASLELPKSFAHGLTYDLQQSMFALFELISIYNMAKISGLCSYSMPQYLS